MAEERLIFHCDCNNFFASCECLERPELKDVPMAVAGDPEYRTGIVVAKNELAKRAGVKTTDTVWQARKKCPGIVFVPPRHGLYRQISRKVNAIYREYTAFVEPASIDESYLDLTGAPAFYGKSSRELADEVRARVREEIGVTISVGVSFNKVFAKMGSDYKKPDATTVITMENYREILYPLPVSDLLYAGKATVEALHRKMIFTVGDLAAQSREAVADWLGKGGEQLWVYANGLDRERVRRFDEREEAKSVSHGMTFRRDLVTEDEVRCGVFAMAEDVAAQLRGQGLTARVVQVQIKTPDLKNHSRQVTLERATCLHREIAEEAMRLLREHWNIGPGAPIRALTVGATRLEKAAEVIEQLSLFDLDEAGQQRRANREKQEKLESALDQVRQKHGRGAVRLGLRDGGDIGLDREEKNPFA